MSVRVLTAMMPLVLACAVTPVRAASHAGPGGNGGVELKTTVKLSREVTADRLGIIVLARAESADPVRAQKAVAERVEKALSELPEGVHASTAGYRASQIERASGDGKDHHPAGSTWRVSETLDLRGPDRDRLWAAAEHMAGQGLVIQALHYDVDRHTRDQVQDSLLSKAIHRWRGKIEVMAQALGCGGFHVIRVQTGPGSQGPHPVVMSAARSPRHAPPAREKLAVSVSGAARAAGCR